MLTFESRSPWPLFQIHFGGNPRYYLHALKDGDTQIETQQVSYGTVAGNAGYADFTVPESSASSDDLSIYAPPTYRHWFSGITLFYAD